MSDTKHRSSRHGVGSAVVKLVPHQQDNFLLLLSQVKAERLLPRDRKFITTSKDEHLPSVLNKFVHGKVMSLPVLNQEGVYEGIVEQYDLNVFIIDLFAGVGTRKTIDVEKLLIAEENFSKAVVTDVMKKESEKNPVLLIGYSLHTVWEALAITGFQRIPILNNAHQLCDFITQSMLVDFLWQNIESIGSLAEIEILSLELGSDIPCIAKATDTTLLVFREMLEKNYSEIPFVDDEGKLIDTLSIRDIKGIRISTIFCRLWSNVADYKKKVREEFDSLDQLFVALPSDSFYSVIEKMATLHLHSIVVVKNMENMKPMYVISLHGILKQILKVTSVE